MPWTKEQISQIYHQPLFKLIYQAATVHREHHPADKIQICSLISIKTGGCPEDCKYCPQSARYNTDLKAEPLMQEAEVLALAQNAVENGASRICLGAAWRSVRDGPQLDRVIEIIKKVAALGVEVCVTLGMLTYEQALRLKAAGVYAYSHNLDTSPEYYPCIISTRTYQDRLDTLDNLEKAKLNVCCGGIVGMGETVEDRIGLLYELAKRNPQPSSVPINILIPVKGTPLENSPHVPIWDMVRMVATARITMPKAMVRLSAGRLERSLEEQALCFLAGANSIHCGEKLLTRPNPKFDQDSEMLKLFGLTPYA